VSPFSEDSHSQTAPVEAKPYSPSLNHSQPSDPLFLSKKQPPASQTPKSYTQSPQPQDADSPYNLDAKRTGKTIAGQYRCLISDCDKSFTQFRYWPDHMKKDHGNKVEFNCTHDYCVTNLNSKRACSRHHKNKHPDCSTVEEEIPSETLPACFKIHYPRHATMCANCPVGVKWVVAWEGPQCWNEWINHCFDKHKMLVARGELLMPEDDPHPERAIEWLAMRRHKVRDYIKPKLEKLKDQHEAKRYEKAIVEKVLVDLLFLDDDKFNGKLLECVAGIVHYQQQKTRPSNQHLHKSLDSPRQISNDLSKGLYSPVDANIHHQSTSNYEFQYVTQDSKKQVATMKNQPQLPHGQNFATFAQSSQSYNSPSEYQHSQSHVVRLCVPASSFSLIDMPLTVLILRRRVV